MMAENYDDIADLTDEPAGSGKGANKSKPNAAKKPAAPPPAQKKGPSPAGNAAASPGGKKKKGIKLKLILIFVPVFLIGAFVALVILNLFGMRDTVNGFMSGPLLSAIVWLDPEFNSVDEELRAISDERGSELDKRETSLDDRRAELDIREDELDGRATALGEREIALDRRSASLDKREETLQQAEAVDEPVFRRILTEQELSSYQSISRSYANMDAEAAARILAQMEDINDAATILYYMSERGAAAILAVMDARFAARLTEIMLEG